MAQWAWPISLAIATVIFLYLYRRSGKSARTEQTRLTELLQQQDKNYRQWRTQAITLSGHCNEMQEIIFQLIAQSLIRELYERWEYAGVKYGEGNEVTISFVVPSRQYHKALMNRTYIRERLRQITTEWDKPWLPTLDFEILQQTTERGAENHGITERAVISTAAK